MDAAATSCFNCESPLQGAYCHQCRQKHIPHEHWGVAPMLAESVENLGNVDNKIFRTLRDVLLRPGVVAYQFNQGQRRRYASPIRMLLFVFLVIFLYPFITDFTQDLSSHLRFGFFTQYAQPMIDTLMANAHQDRTALELKFAEKQVDVASVLVLIHVPFFALVLWALQPQKRFYFIDHIVNASFFLIFVLLFLYLNVLLIGMPLESLSRDPELSKTVEPWLNLILLKLPFPFIMAAFLRFAYQHSWLAAAWRVLPATVGFVMAHMLYGTTVFYTTLLFL